MYGETFEGFRCETFFRLRYSYVPFFADASSPPNKWCWSLLLRFVGNF
jgi:hypothetical protein